MNSKKRERCVNFSLQEQELLLKLANKRKNIINSKRTDSSIWKGKQKAWLNITSDFNVLSTAGITRTTKMLRDKYSSLKNRGFKNLKIDRNIESMPSTTSFKGSNNEVANPRMAIVDTNSCLKYEVEDTVKNNEGSYASDTGEEESETTYVLSIDRCIEDPEEEEEEDEEDSTVINALHDITGVGTYPGIPSTTSNIEISDIKSLAAQSHSLVSSPKKSPTKMVLDTSQNTSILSSKLQMGSGTSTHKNNSQKKTVPLNLITEKYSQLIDAKLHSVELHNREVESRIRSQEALCNERLRIMREESEKKLQLMDLDIQLKQKQLMLFS